MLTAMIIVTLVSTLAAAMVWQQWRAVQVEASERARVQATWILSGALDFARLILREDGKNGQATKLTDPWATPLAEARLSTFLAIDKSNSDDGPEAFLSGNIDDAQSRYNLNNIVASGKVSSVELNILSTLCKSAGVDSSVATTIANGLNQAFNSSSGGASLIPKTVAQLSWLGIDPTSIASLKPFVILLPGVTAVNINTAPPEVLAAVAGVDPSVAAHVVQVRQRTPFTSVGDLKNLGVSPAPEVQQDLGVHSSFFEVRGRLRLVDRVLVERSLVQRNGNNQIVILHRERESTVEPAGT